MWRGVAPRGWRMKINIPRSAGHFLSIGSLHRAIQVHVQNPLPPGTPCLVIATSWRPSGVLGGSAGGWVCCGRVRAGGGPGAGAIRPRGEGTPYLPLVLSPSSSPCRPGRRCAGSPTRKAAASRRRSPPATCAIRIADAGCCRPGPCRQDLLTLLGSPAAPRSGARGRPCRSVRP